MATTSTPPMSLNLLATITPSPQTRTWQTISHPTLPIAATACADKTARIISLSSLSQVATVSGGHKRSVRSVAWKPNSGPRGVKRKHVRRGGAGEGSTETTGSGESVLVTGSFDASAGIWRRWERQSALTADGNDDTAGADGDEAEMDFTRSGKEDDDDEWQFAVVLDGHDSEIKSVGYSPVAPFLATCSRDKSVWVWEEMDDDNFETVAVLQEHEGDVKCVAWHPEEVLLASGSYDDSVRLWREEGEGEDWGCAAVLEGFGGTVWGVEFEPMENVGWVAGGDGQDVEASKSREAVSEERRKAGPRLLTCCDDASIRLYRRIPKEKKPMPTGSGKMPSILKTNSIAEEWVEEARLPAAHERTVYAVSWSRVTGRIVSCGSDGRIVVYEERWADGGHQTPNDDGDVVMNGQSGDSSESKGASGPSATIWAVVAQIDDAHDVFEVNHVTWAPRADKGKEHEDEEVIISTGDGGEVKVWCL